MRNSVLLLCSKPLLEEYIVQYVILHYWSINADVSVWTGLLFYMLSCNPVI